MISEKRAVSSEEREVLTPHSSSLSPLCTDAGPAPLAQASTVLDLSAPQPRLLREGPIGQEALAAARIRAGVISDQ